VTVRNGTASAGTAQDVVWIDPKNVTVSTNTVWKSSGCDGCVDAGAGSSQTLSGDGWVEFKATTGPLGYVGLDGGTTKYSGDVLNFALSFQNGYMGVYENGAYKSDVAFVATDTFRIAIENAVVKYKKNGTTFYTSQVAPTFPLRANAALYGTGAKVSAARVMGSN
jgi:hypothetical protein